MHIRKGLMANMEGRLTHAPAAEHRSNIERSRRSRTMTAKDEWFSAEEIMAFFGIAPLECCGCRPIPKRRRDPPGVALRRVAQLIKLCSRAYVRKAHLDALMEARTGLLNAVEDIDESQPALLFTTDRNDVNQKLEMLNQAITCASE